MKSGNLIYLDYAATAPVDARVQAKMLPFFGLDFGNPSSVHQFGQAAEAALEDARERIAGWLNCTPEEILFTSCGSESDNLAIRGLAFAQLRSAQANHLLISPVEHHAVSRTAEQLARNYDFELEYLPVDRFGRVSPDEVRRRLRPETALVSVIFANNEIGTINPISEIGEVCREAGVYFHTDAVQAGAHLSLDTRELNVDLMSLGAHKFYGPKGVGALFVRKGTAIIPQQTGGSQEYGLRAGTQNVPLIVGMAEALEIAQHERAQAVEKLTELRNQLVKGVLATIPGAALTGHPEFRLSNHASFVFSGVDGNALLMALDLAGFACSSGSACKTGNPEPSEVLLALGLEPDLATSSLRVTLGRWTEQEHILSFLQTLPEIIHRQRQNAVVIQ
jgi:cysteine desulfurase